MKKATTILTALILLLMITSGGLQCQICSYGSTPITEVNLEKEIEFIETSYSAQTQVNRKQKNTSRQQFVLNKGVSIIATHKLQYSDTKKCPLFIRICSLRI